MRLASLLRSFRKRAAVPSFVVATPGTRGKPPIPIAGDLGRIASRAHAPRVYCGHRLAVRLANRIIKQPSREGLTAKPHATRP